MSQQLDLRSSRKGFNPNRLEKLCPKCRTLKLVEEFGLNKSRADGRNGWCKLCRCEAVKDGTHKQDRSPERMRRQLLKRHGLSPEDYQKMFDEQEGRCEICGNPPGPTALHIDHNHNTGQIRGLLCSNCNTGLGMLQESVDNLEAAVVYLNYYRCIGDR